MYDLPDEYTDDKDKKQRRWCLKKALKLEKIRSTDDDPSDAGAEEVVDSAEKFDDFINAQE